MTAQIVDLASFRAARTGAAGLLLAKPQKHDGSMTALLIRDEQRWANHRAEPRHRLDGACKLSLWLGGREATLENISRNGLMATADVPHHPGARVLVSVGGGRTLSGLVIWKRDGMVGLEVPVGTLRPVS
ncbi:MAG TPA: PilZ domain-containing protein [Croceibacterium sp.]|nr:PilZ domain-containing protein [Croceibacterium sp.]